MERFWAFAKEHPLGIGGAIVAVVILIYLYESSGKSSGTAQGVYAQTADPNVVAANAAIGMNQNSNNAALAATKIQADTALSLADVQLTALQNNNAATISLAGIQAGVMNNQTTALSGFAMQSLSDANASDRFLNFSSPLGTLQLGSSAAGPPPAAASAPAATASAPVAATPAPAAPTGALAVINGLTTSLFNVPSAVQAYFAGGANPNGVYHIRQGNDYTQYQQSGGVITAYSDPTLGAAIRSYKNPGIAAAAAVQANSGHRL